MNDNANWRIGTDWSHIRSDVTTLIFSPGSCALAPHIVLEEIGKPFALTLVSTDQGEARTDKFRNLNPKGRIPVLIKGDWMLTEAPAILLHLANDNPMFAPKGQEEVSRALEWFN
ncbi:glutathione S-transferase N-terminal domain-containing protein [bacterium]|nr:glutathione S-transferase N-terminal domain-containing protein [bacterium]